MAALLGKDGRLRSIPASLAPRVSRHRQWRIHMEPDGGWCEICGEQRQRGQGFHSLITHLTGTDPEVAAIILRAILDHVTAFDGPMQPTIIAEFSDIRRVLDQRRKQLGLTMLELDYVSGVQEGYSSKVLAGIKGLGHISFPNLFQALKVEMIIQPIEQQ